MMARACSATRQVPSRRRAATSPSIQAAPTGIKASRTEMAAVSQAGRRRPRRVEKSEPEGLSPEGPSPEGLNALPGLISPSSETDLGPEDHQQAKTRPPGSACTYSRLAATQPSGNDLRQGYCATAGARTSGRMERITSSEAKASCTVSSKMIGPSNLASTSLSMKSATSRSPAPRGL